MKTTDMKLVSSCCDSTVSFVPPLLGEHGFYICDACRIHRCDTHWKEIVTHIKIADGHYRPI